VNDDLVTTSAAAEILGVSRQRAHQLVDVGQLDAMRVETARAKNGMLVFRRADVERLRVERSRRGLYGSA